jgi:tRNA threonylcarbamoyladenosine biosynthesis protein TsaE
VTAEPVQVELATAADTHAFGYELAGVLRAGDLIVLSGPLGAGKTALTQGIGAGLSVLGRVASPTFVIARTHPGGRLPLIHVDAYRLGSLAEVEDMDLDLSLEGSVTVVEWGSGLAEQLSSERLDLAIERFADCERRVLTAHGVGGDWSDRLASLSAFGVHLSS